MRNRHGQRGMALVIAMLAIIIIFGALGLFMTRVHSAKKETDFSITQIAVEEAAQAGVDLALERLWHDYLATNDNEPGDVFSYRAYLNNVLGVPVGPPQDEEGLGWPLLDDPELLLHPESGRVLASIDNIHLVRQDTAFKSRFTIRVAASHQDFQRRVVQHVDIGGQQLAHTQFAILANNINCILCHADIRSLPLEMNQDSSLFNTFDRVKVAALESLLVRPNEANSRVAGTVYTRGEVYHPNGAQFTPQQLANSTFRGFGLGGDGKISQNASGQMPVVPLVNAGTNQEGMLDQFANLYMNYPSDPEFQTDGALPDSFPPPFPDGQQNRLVDDEDFQAVFEMPLGSVTSGVAHGVPRGGAYGGSGLPTESNGAAASLENSGYYDGNLILVGTENEPITLSNTIAVNGDLVLQGPVQGSGQIMVRGNVYITGDVTYADDPGEFGRHSVNPETGEFEENAFAVVSGGSIMMGDYLTVRGVNHSNQNNAKYPNWQQYSIHMRDEHRSNTVNQGGSSETLQWGYFDPWSVDPGEVVPGKPGQQFSFTTSELMLFNNLELEKAMNDASYVPRFYGLREGQPDNLYIYQPTNNDEHAVRYTEPGVMNLRDWLLMEGREDIWNRAALHYLNPDGNWLSESTLRNIWFQDEMTRPQDGRPFLFDGLLYSNNSIFTIVRSFTRHNSHTYGQMRVRGGIVAADLGMFVPGHNGHGLNLMYDQRVTRFLDLLDTTEVGVTRLAFYFERPEAL